MSKEPAGSTVSRPKPDSKLEQRGLSPPKEARVPPLLCQAGWAGWRQAGCPERGELLGQAGRQWRCRERAEGHREHEWSIKLQGCVNISSSPGSE